MELLEHISPDIGGEIQLTDALDKLLQEQPLGAFSSDAQVQDCGNKSCFVKANVAVAKRAGILFD